jgi:plastocyanin domain-containing protein
MISKGAMIGSIVTLSFLLGIASGEATAQMPHAGMQHLTPEQTGQFQHPEQPFQHLEQPLGVKGVVTVGGLGLIGLELWWFLFSKPKSGRAISQGGTQYDA